MDDLPFEITDPSLAEKGLERLEWVRERMLILRHLKARLAEQKPFESLTIGICLHVEAKTGIWLETLAAGSARILITGSPGTTIVRFFSAGFDAHFCICFLRLLITELGCLF